MIRLHLDKPWDNSSPRYHPTCRFITAAGSKGGSGKTTMLYNLAIGLINRGKRVFIVDADEQGSLTATLESRGRGRATSLPQVHSERLTDFDGREALRYKALADNYDYILFDVAGHRSEAQRLSLRIADLALAPIMPSIHDFRALKHLLTMLAAANKDRVEHINLDPLDIRVFVNRDRKNLKDVRGIKKSLQELKSPNIKALDFSLSDKVAYRRSPVLGVSVIEETGDKHDHSAVGEIRQLVDFVLRGEAPGKLADSA